MAAVYPGSVAAIAADKANATVTPTDHPSHHNQLAEELVAVETVLGVNPAGASATVVARLDGVDGTVGTIASDVADINTELGVDPSGGFATVVARLNDIAASLALLAAVTSKINYFNSDTSSALWSNTSYAAVDTNGNALPSVTVTTGTRAIITVSARNVSNNTAGATVDLSFSVSGATTIAAADAQASIHESGAAGDLGSVTSVRLLSLTAGSNTFQMEAKVSAGTGTIGRPRILVQPVLS